jgi:hypothetical protein
MFWWDEVGAKGGGAELKMCIVMWLRYTKWAENVHCYVAALYKNAYAKAKPFTVLKNGT